jgi:L-alanine-DL-glutamate epimerase-like enolase superfamily enzyme
VIVEARLEGGAVGFGEAATIGGPSWNEESPESIFHAVTAYLAPAITGAEAGRFEAIWATMDAACRGNLFAKSAVEMALIDAVSRSLGVPAWQLLGGKRIDSLRSRGRSPAAMRKSTSRRRSGCSKRAGTGSSSSRSARAIRRPMSRTWFASPPRSAPARASRST